MTTQVGRTTCARAEDLARPSMQSRPPALHRMLSKTDQWLVLRLLRRVQARVRCSRSFVRAHEDRGSARRSTNPVEALLQEAVCRLQHFGVVESNEERRKRESVIGPQFSVGRVRKNFCLCRLKFVESVVLGKHPFERCCCLTIAWRGCVRFRKLRLNRFWSESTRYARSAEVEPSLSPRSPSHPLCEGSPPHAPAMKQSPLARPQDHFVQPWTCHH